MLRNQGFLPIIGMEVHVELKTDSKMFCGCSAYHFRVKPNTHTCPVCLGLPGALPVPNKKAIDWCLLLGLALNCQISNFSKFDRKNYFYPDLPKGYQISQYDLPFARNGELKSKVKSQKSKIIRINRVHLEEDTAKLVHIKGATLVDFNRSGVPLVEIVSEPDISSSEEAVVYLKKLQQVVRYLEISDADMEKGSMRCEANVSLLRKLKTPTSASGSSTLPIRPCSTPDATVGRQSSRLKDPPGYKVEIKNINSFRFVKRAIDYEIERQKKLLKEGKIPLQETRGFDEKTGKTYSQRFKEAAHDYRYFPEPDLPPIKLENWRIGKLVNCLPELPAQKCRRFIKQYRLSEYNAFILTIDKNTADYFEEAVKEAKKHRISLLEIANLIVNKKVNIKKYLPARLVKMLVKARVDKIRDKKVLSGIIKKILAANPKAIADFKKGKKEAIGFLLGQVMKETGGKADPVLTRKLLLEKLK